MGANGRLVNGTDASVTQANHMTATLKRVLVCPPANAGWNDRLRVAQWQHLTFEHEPNFAAAQMQHDALRGELERAGVEVVELPANPQFSLDAAYVHDSTLTTNWGAIILNVGKRNRQVEGPIVRAFYDAIEYAVLGEVVAPGTAESGDMVWLDDHTLLAGRGYRTNAAGI